MFKYVSSFVHKFGMAVKSTVLGCVITMFGPHSFIPSQLSNEALSLSSNIAYILSFTYI